MVDYLIGIGADVHAENNDGHTALTKAKRLDIMNALIDAGADADIFMPEDNITLVRVSSGGYGKLVDAMIAAGAEINARDKDQYTALLWAAGNGHPNAENTLLAAGDDVNA